jgi:hypothetical protein
MTMTKQFIIVTGLVLTLGVSFAETVRTDVTGKTAASSIDAVDVSSRATVQLASMWVEHEKVNTRLARPL